MRLKEYEGVKVKLSHQNRAGYINEIHGVINAVTKDNVVLIDFHRLEHVVKKDRIKEIVTVN